jgi:hypothetical protein
MLSILQRMCNKKTQAIICFQTWQQMITNCILQEHTLDYLSNQTILETIEKNIKFWALNRNCNENQHP